MRNFVLEAAMSFKGLTDHDLARLTGYSARTLTQVRLGWQRPSRRLQKRVSEALGIPANILFCTDGSIIQEFRRAV